MWTRSENLKAVWAKWHERRQEARESAPNLVPFGEIEKTAFDLDTADVTGKDYQKNYEWDRPLNDVDGTPNNGTDVRELDRH